MKVVVKLNKKIDSWLIQKRVSVKESTYSRYYEIVEIYIRPYFGNVFTYKINNDYVSKYIYNLINVKKLSIKTIKDILVILKQILKYANIHIDVNCPKYKKKAISILSTPEQKKLEKFLCSNISSINLGILLCLYTGIRIGELCALRWKDIDLKKGILYINHTILRIKNVDNGSKTKVILGLPKTSSSIRDIPIPDEIIKIIRTFYKKKKYNDNFYILTCNIKFMEPRNLYYHYKNIMNDLKLSKYNFHILRHTFATRCIELGFDYKTLSEILGHSDVKITLSIYVHSTKENKINSMKKLHLYNK